MKCGIVFVPGKSPKPPPAMHRDFLWRCLRRGVSRHDPATGDQLDRVRFDIAAWNFLYYERHGSLAPDVPWIERLIGGEGASRDDVREARHWSKWLTKLMYTVGDHFHFLAGYLPDPRVKAMIRDTLRYFENTDGIADKVRDLVKAGLRRACDKSDSVCLIGHSMGSVIAYEALWSMTHDDDDPVSIDLFLTLGSPLGMHYVQRKLLGFRQAPASFPADIERWVNISATGDLVSVDERVGDDFHAMVREGLVGSIEDIHRGVYTSFRDEAGLNCHRSYGYLVHPRVGAQIARWLEEGAP